MAADLLGLFEEHGLKPKRASGKKYHSGCPGCGGKDRCLVVPTDNDGRGAYWCHACGAYGDNIQFLRDYKGLSYKDACKEAGIQASRATAALPKAPRKAPGQEHFESAPSVPPAELWTRRATAFAAWAHEHLVNAPEPLAWLAERGLPLEAVKLYRLGWNPGERGKSCLIRPRAVWGLPLPEAKEGERPKTTFWLPRGVVIPMLGPDGSVLRLRIRRPDSDRAEFKSETKYYVIPGSNMDAMILGRDASAFVVVESELDALMLHHQAGDLAGAVSVMTSTVRKIEASALGALSRALCVLVALDCDDAGAKGFARWGESLPRAKRWPCPVGKDPGEAFAAGANLRAWILAGLPPVLQPGLLPSGQPAVEGEVEREQGAAAAPPAPAHASAATAQAAMSPAGPSGGAPSTASGVLSTPEGQNAPDSGNPSAPPAAPSALPAWMEPVSRADLEASGESGAALLELSGLFERCQARPCVLMRGADRGVVLLVPDEAWFSGLDPADFGRLRALFFGRCLGAAFGLAMPRSLRAARSIQGCFGRLDGGREWAALVKNEDGLSVVGWRRLDHWFE